MQISSDEHNQGLGCCCKLSPEVTENENTFKGYLSSNEVFDEKIPNEFIKSPKIDKRTSLRLPRHDNDHSCKSVVEMNSPIVRMSPKNASFNGRDH